MLKIDYWSLEVPASQPVWANSQLVRDFTSPVDRIVSVSGGDPTLLYLSNRKGWLASPEDISIDKIKFWRNSGAKYISGSWDIVESYSDFKSPIIKCIII